MKSLDPENIFHLSCAVKAKKLTAVGLFKVESVLSKNKKSKFQRKFGKFLKFFFAIFKLLLNTDSTLTKPIAVNV